MIKKRFIDLFLGDERRRLQESARCRDDERRRLQESRQLLDDEWRKLQEDPASFGVIDNRGEMYFIMADNMTVTQSGQLLFWRHDVICAAVSEGKWERVLKGISMDDIKEAED